MKKSELHSVVGLIKGWSFGLFLFFVNISVFSGCLQQMIEPTGSPSMIDFEKPGNHRVGDLELMDSLKNLCPSCRYVVPPGVTNIDGKMLNLKPGDTIGLLHSINYGMLRFANLKGSEARPIIITNCGGKGIIYAPGAEYAVKVVDSKYFRVTGGENNYGILLTGSRLGITLDYRSTNFEVDHVEVTKVGAVGIMAKTDPSCNDSTIRDNFTMRDISIHDNFVHTTGNEGIYVGNSFYNNGVAGPCGIRKPHAIVGVKLYNNRVQFTGWDGVQLGSAVSGAAVFNNDIKYFGTKGEYAQNSGIQIGEGTGGLCYNNLIKDGTGNGITMLGLGDNVVAGNVIIGVGASGIFCDDRYISGNAFKFTNNIILNPKGQGLRIYSTRIPNIITDNVIVGPQNTDENNQGENVNSNALAQLGAVNSSHPDYIFIRNRNVKVIESNNVLTRNTSQVKDIYIPAFQYEAITQNPSDKPLDIKSLLKGVKVPLPLD